MEKKNSTDFGKALVISVVVFLPCLVYAVVRYHIVRNTPVEQFPLYIMNKTVSLSATIVIGLSFLLGPLANFFPRIFVPTLKLRKGLGIVGFGIAALHAMMSLLLFNSANYAKFFLESGKMNLIGESSMLFGILAFFIFSTVALIGIPSIEEKLHPQDWKTVLRFGYIAYILVLFHVAVMGWSGWFQADSWQYGMASITLVAATFIVFVLILRSISIAFPHKRS